MTNFSLNEKLGKIPKKKKKKKSYIKKVTKCNYVYDKK